MTIEAILEKLMDLAYQMPKHGFMVLIAPDTFRVPLEQDIGPLKRRRPAVWWKCNPGMGYGFRRSFEDIHLYTNEAWKPRTSLPGVIPVPRGHDRYATSKPTLLWHYILEAFAQPGWTILDPFGGGGSVGDAATILGMEVMLEDLPDDCRPQPKIIQQNIIDSTNRRS